MDLAAEPGDGKLHAEDEDLLRAASIAGLLEFVNQHPQGFDMLIGERGSR